ncbi:MAG: sulfatase family protein [Solirubrobacterales bacterium]
MKTETVDCAHPRLLAALVIALVASAALAAPAAEARPAAKAKDDRPNILVVMTDDMAADDIAHLPNVKRLLQNKGTTFENAIDSFPLCCPARATFITGQYAHNHGVIGNFNPYGWYGMKNRANTLPSWLQDAGYDTTLIGKWLNGYGAKDGVGEVPAGWDTWRGLLDLSAYDYFNYVMNKDGKLQSWGDPAFAAGLVEFGNIQVVPGPQSVQSIQAKLQEVFGPPPYSYWGTEETEDYSPDVTGQITQDRIKKEAKSKNPFFIWWSVAAPHREDVATALMGRPGPDPRPAPRFADDVADLELPRPPNFDEGDISDKGSPIQQFAKPLTEAQLEMLRLNYQGRIGSLLAVDERVGQLISQLKKTDQLENTMIMFLSDNGWLQGEHRIPGDKFLPYEESIRVPMILRGPGVPKGQTIEGQVSNIDFAPTLVDAAGAKAGRTMDGVSLLPTAKKPSRRPDRALEIEAPYPLFAGNIPVNQWDRPYSGVRTDRFTYIVWTESGDEELYDRDADPYQLQNVAADPAFAEVKADLAAKLVELDKCKGRSCDVRP